MRITAAFCVILTLLCINAWGQDAGQTIIDGQYEASGAPTLENAAGSAQGFDSGFSFKSVATGLAGGKFPITPKEFISRIIELLTGEVKACAAGGAQIIFAAILLGLLAHFSLSQKGVFDTAFYVCYAVILGITLKVFGEAAQVGKSAVSDMSLFMKNAVPVMAALSFSTGNATRAGISAVALQGVQFTAWLVESLFMPLAYMTAALCAAGNLTKDFSLKGFVGLAKKAATYGLGFVLTVFSGVLVAQGMVASATDNVAGKAVKYAVGNFVPVIGGILSDSIDTVAACGAALKNAVGVAGIVAVVYICLTPAIKLCAMIIVLRIAGAAAGMVSDSRLSDVIGDFAGLLGLVEAMVLGVGLMFIVALAVLASGAGYAPAP